MGGPIGTNHQHIGSITQQNGLIVSKLFSISTTRMMGGPIGTNHHHIGSTTQQIGLTGFYTVQQLRNQEDGGTYRDQQPTLVQQ